jgi:hypothetical protein
MHYSSHFVSESWFKFSLIGFEGRVALRKGKDIPYPRCCDD